MPGRGWGLAGPMVAVLLVAVVVLAGGVAAGATLPRQAVANALVGMGLVQAPPPAKVNQAVLDPASVSPPQPNSQVSVPAPTLVPLDGGPSSPAGTSPGSLITRASIGPAGTAGGSNASTGTVNQALTVPVKNKGHKPPPTTSPPTTSPPTTSPPTTSPPTTSPPTTSPSGGKTGPSGPPGPTGPSGANGAPGAPGAPGAHAAGSGAPSGNLAFTGAGTELAWLAILGAALLVVGSIIRASRRRAYGRGA